MMGNRELFWSQCRGIGLNLELIWDYPEIFNIPAVTSVFFKTCEGFLGDSLYFPQANQGSLPV